MVRRVSEKASKTKKNIVVVNEFPKEAGIELTMPYNFTPRDYQKNVFNYFIKENGKRAVTVWHRRAGKDLLAINTLATLATQRPGSYLHLFPYNKQAKSVIWHGMDNNGKKFLDAFPEELVVSKNENEMKLHLVNGSIYQCCGTDNLDGLIGTNPIGIVFSEYSLMSSTVWDLFARPILRLNNGWAWFIYTPRGKNHGFKLYERAKLKNDWFVEKLGINQTKLLTQADVDEDIEE